MLVLILAAGLRFHRLEAQSFWNDEGNSARIAERPVAQIVEGAAGDIHPPGYYLLLAGWRSVAGQSEFGLRFPSALAGVLAVAVVYAVGAALSDRRTGLIATLLAAISPFQVYYSQEARMYALVTLLSAASIWLTIKVLELPGAMVAGRLNRRHAARVVGGYILVNAAGLYTHYSFPLTLLAETAIFALWLARRVLARCEARLRMLLHGLAVWIGLHGAALLLFAPWIPTALRQVSTWPRGGGADAVGAAGVLTALAYGITLPVDGARAGLIPLLLTTGLGLLPPIDPRDARRYLRFGERIGLVAAWVIVPLAALGVLGAITQPYLKFLLPANLALGLIAARGLVMGYDLSRPTPGVSPLNNLFLRLVVAALAALSAWPGMHSLSNLYFDPTYARDDYRAIAARIMAEAGPEAAVVLDAPNQWEVFTYYYPDGPNIAPLPSESTEDTIDRLLRGSRRIYALYWGENQRDPQGVVRRTLESRAFEAGSQWYGGVLLVTYVVAGELAADIEMPSGAQFGEQPGIVLDGYTLSGDSLIPGEALGVTLFWHTEASLSARYKVFVHLYGPDGSLVAQHDSEPGNFGAPTDTWTPGQTVIDHHGLTLPDHAMPGIYRLAVGLYPLDNTARLAIVVQGQGVGDALTLAQITVR